MGEKRLKTAEEMSESSRTDDDILLFKITTDSLW